MAKRATPVVNITDPLFPDQWHLKNTGQMGGTPGQDINVTAVWNLVCFLLFFPFFFSVYSTCFLCIIDLFAFFFTYFCNLHFLGLHWSWRAHSDRR